MTTPDSVIAAAETFLGMGEYPDGSNHNDITAWYGFDGPWCAMGVSRSLAKGGFSTDGGGTCLVPGVRQTTRKGWAFVPYLHDDFAAVGRLVSTPQRGDVFMLRSLGHTGLVAGVDLAAGTFDTVEMNYSNRCTRVRRSISSCVFARPPYDGALGPVPTPAPPAGPRTLNRGMKGDDVRQWQDQLNHVAPYGLVLDGDFGPATESATRSFQTSHGCTVDGVVGPQSRQAMAAALNAPPPAPAPAPPPPPPPAPGPARAPDGNPFTPLGVDGDFGPQTTRALQWKLGVAADGQFGPASKRALQGRLGVAQDGVVGPQTVRALQARVGAGQDGQWGPDTTRHLQDALNRGAF